jgi:hypothetical protein
VRVLPLVLLVPALAGCGASGGSGEPAGDEHLTGHAFELTLPHGWYGSVTKAGAHDAATLRAATFPVAGMEAADELGRRARATMGPDDLLLVVADYGPTDESPSAPPLRFRREHVAGFEGFLEPVATTSAVVSERALQLWLVTADAPTDAQLRQANAVLATLRVQGPRWEAYRDEPDGFSIDVPPRWVVSPGSLTPSLTDPREILAVGTGALLAGGDRCAHVPERALDALGPADALVTLVEFDGRRGLPPRPADLIAAAGEDPESRDCLADAGRIDYRLIPFADAGRDFYLYVAFGERVSDERRSEAETLLASLRFDRSEDAAFDDGQAGVSGRHPAGWHRERALTRLAEPRELLALASYPLRRGAEAGECAPDTARGDMPVGGAFVWLLEYAAALPRERFPERPASFRLTQDGLVEHVSCFPGPGWTTTFGEAGRQFQLLVAFGGRPTAERMREVEDVLDALRFEPLRPPPRDSEATWPLLIGSTPDSMRAPPRWAAAAAGFSPADERRPRTLFFASNRPLFGLPATLQREPRELPRPLPGAALANGFPADGVLVWVVEEADPPWLAERFAPIDSAWPGRTDFEPVEIATKADPDLLWLVAGGEFRGHRFSVWIGRGPTASEADLELALRSAGSLAVSGCDRGVGERCGETR